MDERKTVLVIDFNNFVFASYYGQPLYNMKGLNVSTIIGFFKKLNIIKEMYDPEFIVFASDLSRDRTFRRKLYSQYKAQRKPMDPELHEQMRYISNLVALLGFQTLNNETYEADDIMGMISRYASTKNMKTVLISSDRDLYQLVNDDTTIMPPRGDKIIDKVYIKSTYGLTPEQWIELKMLQGDPSDNIPGIVGIGPKTAVKLMNDFGSIENIYKHIELIRPAISDLLIAGESTLPLTRRLVTILTDYNLINLDMRNLYRKRPYPKELYEMLNYLEIKSILSIMKYSLLPQPNDKIIIRDN